MKQLATMDDLNYLSVDIKNTMDNLLRRVEALEYTVQDLQRELARLTTPANTVSISSGTIGATPTYTNNTEYQPYGASLVDGYHYRLENDGSITII